MNTRRLFILFVIVFVVSFGLNTNVARGAATYTLNYSGFGGTCDASGFTVTATGSYNYATAVVIQGTTTLNGVAHDTYTFSQPAGTLTYDALFGRTFSPALPSANFTFVFRSVVTAGGVSYWVVTVTLVCSGGSLSGSASGVPVTGPFSGPPLPAGFVLKTITCDVAVFDAPGGNPVGSNAIKAGQTWYVNPTPKSGPDGRSWTEVFVAGYTNGYVPTSCVH